MSDQPNEAAERRVGKPIPILPATWLILVVAEFCVAAWRVGTNQGFAAAAFLPLIGQTRRRGLYSYLSEEGLIQLARTFNAGYIVTETSAEPLSLPLLHENKRGRLYQLESSGRPQVQSGASR
ncbi:MAG TPA: hypothetical protein VMZ31_03655 [Phycisphaerae bacterium]|nr:hypothetical protein [Phycisphaerae bacterium]